MVTRLDDIHTEQSLISWFQCNTKVPQVHRLSGEPCTSPCVQSSAWPCRL